MSSPFLGIDVGGTFTDIVTRSGRVLKLPSNAEDPGGVFARALDGLGIEDAAGLEVVHGTTVVTNALLTGALAPVGILVTKGFRDLIALGRQNRPSLFALHPRPTLQPPRHVAEVRERIDAAGGVLTSPDAGDVLAAGRRLRKQGAKSFVVCFLHSWRNPENERLAVDILRDLGCPAAASSDLVPEFREYERFVTAWTNAGLRSLMEAYVGRIRAALPRASIRMLQSDGGRLSLDRAREEPLRLALSGPAGGLLGAWAGARAKGRRRLMTLDMGGTSTDVALMEAGPGLVSECVIGGRPLKIPVMDIHTVGAGGGSVAWVDGGGALRVGPRSAGADPGPAAYGRGGPFTVTDAHVLLGRIPEGRFLGGDFDLDGGASRRAARPLARKLGLAPEALALGVLRVAEATMERALRTISLERGHDPRRFALVAFGGAGGLHACALAENLDMDTVVVPWDPGLLSARGMLSSRVIESRARGVLGVSLEELQTKPARMFAALEKKALRTMQEEGFSARDVVVERLCDLRYVGQSFELTIPFSAGRLKQAFDAAHESRHGFALPNDDVEPVALRVRVLGPKPGRPRRPRLAKTLDVRAHRDDVVFPKGVRRTAIWSRADLPSGFVAKGPAIVAEYSATTVVLPGWTLEVEAASAALVLRRQGRRRP